MSDYTDHSELKATPKKPGKVTLHIDQPCVDGPPLMIDKSVIKDVLFSFLYIVIARKECFATTAPGDQPGLEVTIANAIRSVRPKADDLDLRKFFDAVENIQDHEVAGVNLVISTLTKAPSVAGWSGHAHPTLAELEAAFS
jgi:hypothetical protein